MNLREIIERRIAELEATEHSGAIVALRASIGTELINAWVAGELFTIEDAVDMMKESFRDGFAEGSTVHTKSDAAVQYVDTDVATAPA